MIIPTFLKWAGGKRRLLEEIDKHLPEKINRYYEPFLGAGSMFFYIKQKYNPKNCIISDINKDLVDTFIAVRDCPIELMNELDKLNGKTSKRKYYEIRELFNRKLITGIKRCAVFIYLNKTCFNGLYRVNSKGDFNVPMGTATRETIYEKEIILFASFLLQDVDIRCCDYAELKNEVRSGDFFYMDPCYDPLKKTSFANYTPTRFSDVDNDRLADFIYYLKSRSVKILFSNNITQGVKVRYPKNEGFKWIFLECSRPINSISSRRGKIAEILVKSGY